MSALRDAAQTAVNAWLAAKKRGVGPIKSNIAGAMRALGDVVEATSTRVESHPATPARGAYHDVRDLYGVVFAVLDGDVVVCQPCAKARGVDLGDDRVETWEVGGAGWLGPRVCADCKLSIPVVVDGVDSPEGAAQRLEERARRLFAAYGADNFDRRTWDDLDPSKRKAWLRVAATS